MNAFTHAATKLRRREVNDSTAFNAKDHWLPGAHAFKVERARINGFQLSFDLLVNVYNRVEKMRIQIPYIHSKNICHRDNKSQQSGIR